MTPAINVFIGLMLLLPQAPAMPVGQPRMALDLVVSGPDSSLPGDLVVLSAEQSQGATATAWAISPKSASGRMLAVEGGSKVVFATSQPGLYQFFLAGGTADGKTVKIVSHDVLVGGAPPPNPPGPGPNPPPGPTPPVPPGPTPSKFGFEAFVLGQANALSVSGKRDTALKLAAACDAVVSQIGAGVLKSDAEIGQAIQTQAMSQVGLLTLRSWKGVLTAIRDQWNVKGVMGTADSMEALTEIAAGFRSVP